MKESQSAYRLLLIVIFHFSFFIFNYSQETLSLNGEWEFKKKGEPRYRRATVPGVVHLDLMQNRMIQDPYWGNNELRYQWIENETWVYKKSFTVSKEQLNFTKADIVFEGLDTYASVYLNGEFLLASDNMHLGITEMIKSKLNLGENSLEVHFHPLSEVETYQQRKYDLPAGCETVKEKRSPWVRKAAYHFGWDWGPRFVTCGIWRAVRLEFYDSKLMHPHIYTRMIKDDKAHMSFTTLVSGKEEKPLIRLIINEEDTIENQIGQFERMSYFQFEIENPQLWWCNGLGEPNLYRARVEMLDSKSNVLAFEEFKFGVRTVELINEKDSVGTSFYFKLNDKPVFVKGANYIPQDLFLPSVRNENYHQLLSQVDDANMNMLRVWGGGIYENNIFYDLCDQKGIMVWQDFMFAGSMYPKEIENALEGEVIYNILRLRNHPSIALWCGNNEMEVAWNNWGWQKQYGWSKKDSTEIWETYEYFFYELIPGYLKAYYPNANYTPSSPLSNWGTPDNFKHSSMHYWGVWHGKEPIENYRTNVGRFMVEYGFQSYPEMNTINKFCYPKDQKLSSKIMVNRQKSYIGNEEILKQIKKYAGKPKDFQEFVELSQEVQAKALQIAITAHMKAQPHCMGTMFWQLNDCWPGPSWSVIDYYGNEKKAYDIVKILFEEK